MFNIFRRKKKIDLTSYDGEDIALIEIDDSKRYLLIVNSNTVNLDDICRSDFYNDRVITVIRKTVK